VGGHAFKGILPVLIATVTAWTLWNPFGKKGIGSHGQEGRLWATHVLLSLLADLYGEFVQAGVKLSILAATYSGQDLMRGNEMKAFSILLPHDYCLPATSRLSRRVRSGD
jgi:hypothetical protein